jgi:hypothetical protein
MADRRKGVCLVLGGASGVWDDIEAALQLGEYRSVVTCNDVTSYWPGKIDACTSLHSSSWPAWLSRRAAGGLPPPERIIGHLEAMEEGRFGVTDWLEYRFEGQDRSGSSGLFALKVALIDLGYDKAVLCGVPMTVAGAHFFNASDWDGALPHRKGWNQALPQIAARARSMSGWTRELLGPPTKDWLG